MGLVLLLALFGWAQGFISGVLAFAGLALGRLDRDADRAARPVRGRAVAVGARVRPARRADRRRARSPGCSRRSATPVRRALRAIPGFGAADGALGAVLIAVAGLGVVWILGALAVQSGTYRIRMEVQRSAILQRLNTVLPPSGPLLNSLRRLDPFPRIDGHEARRRPAASGIARDPGGAGGGRERGQDPRHRVRARRLRLGLGRRRRARGHERARGGRRARHARAAAAAASRACPPQADPLRPAQRHRDPARGRARRGAAAARAGPDVGHERGDPRLPAQRAVRRARRAAGGDAARELLRRVRARAGRALDDRAARPRAAGELRRADGRRRRAGWSRRSSRRRRAGRAAATACRTRWCGARSANAGGPVSTGPCAG